MTATTQHLKAYQVKEYGSQKYKVVFLLGGWKTKQWLYNILSGRFLSYNVVKS